MTEIVVLELPEETSPVNERVLFAREVADRLGENVHTILELLNDSEIPGEGKLLQAQLYEALKFPIVIGLTSGGEAKGFFSLAVELDGQRTKGVGSRGRGSPTVGTVTLCGFELDLAASTPSKRTTPGLYVEPRPLARQDDHLASPNLPSSIVLGDVDPTRLANTIGWRLTPKPEESAVVFRSEEDARDRLAWLRAYLQLRNAPYVYDLLAEVFVGEGPEGPLNGKPPALAKKENPRARGGGETIDPLLDALLYLRTWVEGERVAPIEGVPGAGGGNPFRFIPEGAWEKLARRTVPTRLGIWDLLLQQATERLWLRSVHERRWYPEITAKLEEERAVHVQTWAAQTRRTKRQYEEALYNYAVWRIFGGERGALKPAERRRVEQEVRLLRQLYEQNRVLPWSKLVEELDRPGRTLQERLGTWKRLRAMLMPPDGGGRPENDGDTWVLDREGNPVVCLHTYETYTRLGARATDVSEEIQDYIRQHFAEKNPTDPLERCRICGEVLGRRGALEGLVPATGTISIDETLRDQIYQETMPIIRSWIEFQRLVSDRARQEFTDKVVDSLGPLVEVLQRKIRKNRALSQESRALQLQLFTGVYVVVMLARIVADNPEEVVVRSGTANPDKKRGVRLAEWCVEVLQAVYGQTIRQLVGQDPQLAGLGTDMLRRYVEDATKQIQRYVQETSVSGSTDESGNLAQSVALEAAEFAWWRFFVENGNPDGMTPQEAALGRRGDSDSAKIKESPEQSPETPKRAPSGEQEKTKKVQEKEGSPEPPKGTKGKAKEGKSTKKGGEEGSTGETDGGREAGTTKPAESPPASREKPSGTIVEPGENWPERTGFRWPAGVDPRGTPLGDPRRPTFHWDAQPLPRDAGEARAAYTLAARRAYLGLWAGGAAEPGGAAALKRRGFEAGKPAEGYHVHRWNLWQVDGKVYDAAQLQEPGFWEHHWRTEDTFCGSCFRSWAGVLESSGEAVQELFDQQADLENFFNYMVYACPEGSAGEPFHQFEEEKCTRCGVTPAQLDGRDGKYYERYAGGKVWREKNYPPRHSELRMPPGGVFPPKTERGEALLRQKPDLAAFARESYRAIQAVGDKMELRAYENALRNLGLTGRVFYSEVLEGKVDPAKTAGEAEYRESTQRLEAYILQLVQTCARINNGKAAGKNESQERALVLRLKGKINLQTLGREPLDWIADLQTSTAPAEQRRAATLWMLLDLVGQAGPRGYASALSAAGQALQVLLLRQILAAERMRSRLVLTRVSDEEEGDPEPDMDSEPEDDNPTEENIFTYEGMDYEGENESVVD